MISSIIIFIFLTLNLTALLSANYSYSYKDKVEAIKWAKKYITGKTYSVEALGECPRFGGYRYLLSYYVGVAKGLDVDKPRNLAKEFLQPLNAFD